MSRGLLIVIAAIVSCIAIGGAAIAKTDAEKAAERGLVKFLIASWTADECELVSLRPKAMRGEQRKLVRLLKAAGIDTDDLKELTGSRPFRRKIGLYLRGLGLPRRVDYFELGGVSDLVCDVVARDVRKGGDLSKVLRLSR